MRKKNKNSHWHWHLNIYNDIHTVPWKTRLLNISTFCWRNLLLGTCSWKVITCSLDRFSHQKNVLLVDFNLRTYGAYQFLGCVRRRDFFFVSLSKRWCSQTSPISNEMASNSSSIFRLLSFYLDKEIGGKVLRRRHQKMIPQLTTCYCFFVFGHDFANKSLFWTAICRPVIAGQNHLHSSLFNFAESGFLWDSACRFALADRKL